MLGWKKTRENGDITLPLSVHIEFQSPLCKSYGVQCLLNEYQEEIFETGYTGTYTAICTRRRLEPFYREEILKKPIKCKMPHAVPKRFDEILIVVWILFFKAFFSVLHSFANVTLILIDSVAFTWLREFVTSEPTFIFFLD